jgi:HEAT repeat protein
MRKTLIALSLLVSSVALAGRGGSYARIATAIASNDADTIIAELERAERLICARCVAPVMELLDHDDYRVREVAAWWFARRPMLKAAITMQSLARLADPATAARAADVLGTFRHPSAVPALATALRAGLPSEARAAAVRALGTIAHPSAEAAIVGALSDPDAATRAAAATAYYDLRGTRDGAALVAGLADGDARVRREAAAVIGNLRTASARAALEGLLASDPDALVRRNAAWALGQLDDPASRPALERAAASDPVMFVRSVARSGLAVRR